MAQQQPITGVWFPNVLVANDITWGTNLKVCAVLDTWNPDVDLALGYDTVGPNVSGQTPFDHEASGSGYTAGGINLTNVGYSVAGGRFTLTADDVVFSSVTLAGVRHVVFYDPNATTPVANPIVAVYTYTDLLTNSGGNFTVPLADISDGAPVDNCVAALRNPGVS